MTHSVGGIDSPTSPDNRPDPAADHPGSDIETAYLGRFGEFEAPIILDVLREHGIFAMTRASASAGWRDPYGLPSGHGEIMVDRLQLEEARRLVRDVVPVIVEEMRASLESEFGSAQGNDE